ncbi:hypothetical protein C3B58_05730 [Lactonifactor longoviformis]|uniref:DnaJ domain-containing protein n=1 Tax=Lactonifactor longoviformis DSM 17459 TaxID=1122155 RepID=A0A1M4U1V9_9CLOT|nr:J domain-containing protein [Lactonifactor longoviformis]POP33803.1 hypothetical protein C3B58_05730 [Lactonifactor longoviformis]SHE50665.1 DnaJ domain-containing protein [Lactonifactor longoviformis DSM 17459]
MKNSFEILEILPTTDIRQIKKAYARLASIYHPEEFPKEFQELHEAYEEALRIAKEGTASEGTPSFSSAAWDAAPSSQSRSRRDFSSRSHAASSGSPETEGGQPYHFHKLQGEEEPSEENPEDSYDYQRLFEQEKFIQQQKIAELTEKALSQARALMEDGKTRNNLKAWSAFLTGRDFVRLREEPIFLDAYADFLEMCRQMKRPIWKLHDKAFQLSRYQKPPRGAHEKLYQVLDSRYQGVKFRAMENSLLLTAISLVLAAGIFLGRTATEAGSGVPIPIVGGILLAGFTIFFVSVRKRLKTAYKHALFAALLLLIGIFSLAGNQVEVGVMRNEELANVSYGILCFGFLYGIVAGICSLITWIRGKASR